MIYYDDLDCPVCGKRFQNSDDIVVCPACGAPHHRVCWQEAGHCAHESAHGTTDEWRRPQKVVPEEPLAQDEAEGVKAEEVPCPRCGHQNTGETLFCVKCGSALWQNREGIPGNRAGGPFGPLFTARQDPYGGVDPEKTIEGVKVADIAAYVGSNTAYYLPRFAQMSENGSKVTPNWASFLLAQYWLLYRRVTKFFLIFFVAFQLLSIPNYIVFFQQLSAMMQDISYAFQNWAPNPLYYTENEQMLVLSNIFYFLSIGVRMALFLFGNHFYMRHVLTKIRKLRAAYSDEAGYQQALRRRGGAHIAYPLILIAAMFIGMYTLAFVLTML